MNTELLRQTSIFDEITDGDLEKLVHCFNPEVQSYSKNELIYSIGDKVTSIGIIISGSVRVFTQDYFGNISMTAIMGRGEIFGDICMGTEKSGMTMRSYSESQIMFIDFRKMVGICPLACGYHIQILRNLLKVYATMNSELGEKLQILQKRTTREKLLAYLYLQAKKLGRLKVSIPFSRQGLAEYLSVDRSAMSRELCEMRNEGILEFYKSSFILDSKENN